MLKLAVAGLGIWGQRHVRSARDSGCFEVVAAVDPDTERAQPIADELGLELHSSLDGVLSNTNIDALTQSGSIECRLAFQWVKFKLRSLGK